MARRSALPGQPSYVPHPASAPKRALYDQNESAFSRFLRTEIWAPEKFPGNVNILISVSLFFGGIVAARTWGELLVPAA